MTKSEIANSLTHALSLLIFIVASIFLVQKGMTRDSNLLMFSLGIFIVSMFLLYLFSTAYHASVSPKLKHVLRHFDHIGIYLLIAGSYTPILLYTLGGTLGWISFGIIWGIALIGTLYKVFFFGRFKTFSLILYLAMGWSFVFIAKPFLELASSGVLLCILTEGLFYTAGTYFYVRDKQHTYYHAIWHLFVFAGTAAHIAAVWLLI